MSAGHAEHFLSRLDRVSWQQMEYALALYNDAPMVSHVLAALRLGPEVERVALSLDHPELGPFVVVTRDAKFVTCLGHGMRPTGLKVVPRERYEAIIERKSALTEACARARRSGRAATTCAAFATSSSASTSPAPTCRERRFSCW
jgi:hypothetical protein